MKQLLARVHKSGRPRWPVLLLGALLVAGTVAALIWLLAEVWPEAEDETWTRILETGVLRVCTDPSWPPFETVDAATGQIRGLDVDLAGHLAERLAPGTAVRAEIVPVGFDSLYDALLAGRCDAVLSALPYEPERTEDVAYSLAYFNAGLVIVVRDTTTGIETLQDLAGRVVGVEWGFVPEGDSRQRLLLRELPLRRYDTAADVLRALQAGEIDVALVDQISALAYGSECHAVRITSQPLTDVSYVIPVRLDSFRLLKEIDRVLLDMRKDRMMEVLLDRWF